VEFHQRYKVLTPNKYSDVHHGCGSKALTVYDALTTDRVRLHTTQIRWVGRGYAPPESELVSHGRLQTKY
jgi:hypothetical protein